MDKALPERLELRRRMHVRSGPQRRQGRVIGILAIVVITILALIGYWRFSALGVDWGDLFRHARGNFAKRPFHGAADIFMLLVLVFHGFYLYRAKKYERLVLDHEGIFYHSPMPGLLQVFNPSWSARWSQIRSASIQASPLRANGPLLILRVANGQRRIAPFLWVDAERHAADSFLKVSRWLVIGPGYATAGAVEESPVMRYISKAAPDLNIQRDPGATGMSFAMERSPQAMTVIAAFFIAGGYVLVDGLLVRSEVYVEAPFYLGFALLGIAVAVVSGVWLRRSAVPVLESSVLALLLGSAVGAAAYPAALRINALTDPVGLHSYEYVRAADGSYLPPAGDLPSLSFSGYGEYWGQFAAGSTYEFQLRRGGLGFFQLNMVPVRAAMRNYYTSHR